MAGKKQSFRDILRSSFPVDVGGLLGGPEEDSSGEPSATEDDTVASGDTVSPDNTVAQCATVDPQDTVPPTDTDVYPETVLPQMTVALPATVSLKDTAPSTDTVSPVTTVSSRDPVISHEQVELTSNYFSMDADVFDILPKVQAPFEQLVYRYLYRESYGRKSRTCFVGLKTLTETCQLSKNTVRRALDSLEAKGHIRRVERFNDRDHKGTIYRVFLPCEISEIQSQTTFTLIGD